MEALGHLYLEMGNVNAQTLLDVVEALNQRELSFKKLNKSPAM